MDVKKLLILLYFFISFAATGQNVGIGIITPKARLHVADSSVVFSAAGAAPGSVGDVPISGAGRRMLWYADKAAFRAGYVPGVNWDKDSIGYASFAFGNNAKAKGLYAAAWGEETKATGDIGSTAFGYGSTASARYSTAWGENSTAAGYSSTASGYATTAGGLYSFAANNVTYATGNYSTSFGSYTTASGTSSVTFGASTYAKAPNGAAFGAFNDNLDAPDPSFMNGNDRIFQIGNGDVLSRSNAMTILRNGNTGLGSLSPGARLHIANGSSGYVGGYFPGAIIEGGGASYLDFLTPNGAESGVLFGKTSDAAHGGIIYNNTATSNGLQFRTNGNTTQMVINSAGNVGIGTTAPEFPLHFASNLGEKISLWGNFGSNYGLGIASNLLMLHTDIPASDIAFGYGGWGFFQERMRIKGTGNVGIGTSTPTEKLEVIGNVKASSYNYSSPKTFYYSIQPAAFQATSSTDEITVGYDKVHFTSTPSSGAELLAPVYLPQGAVVTAFTVYFQDNSAIRELKVDFLSHFNTNSSSGVTIIASIVTAAVTGPSSLTDNNINLSQIDNQSSAYFVSAKCLSGSWPASDLFVRTVVIAYTLSSAQ